MRKFKSPTIHQTPLYRATAAYSGMKARCLNANGKNPTYAVVELKMTLEQWLEWAVPRYERFIADRPGVSPSAARKGDAGHYEIGNVEIISNIENRAQQAKPGQLRPDGMKRCCSCRTDKSAVEFAKNKSNRDGLHTQCKPCAYAGVAAWRQKKRTSSTTVAALAS